MSKLIMLKGLQGSGKSTLAKQIVKGTGNAVRINAAAKWWADKIRQPTQPGIGLFPSDAQAAPSTDGFEAALSEGFRKMFEQPTHSIKGIASEHQKQLYVYAWPGGFIEHAACENNIPESFIPRKVRMWIRPESVLVNEKLPYAVKAAVTVWEAPDAN